MGSTHRDVDLELPVGRGPEPRVEDHAPELYLAAGLVDRSVGLHEDRVALVDVVELRRVDERVAGDAARQEPVLARARVADLKKIVSRRAFLLFPFMPHTRVYT